MKVITGASSGIGKAIVNKVDDKESLILVSRRDPQIKGAKYIKCDFTKIKEIKNLIERIQEITTKIDLIVHSAGIMESSVSNKLELESLNKTFLVNTIAPLSITSNLTKQLSRAKGTVVAISSIASILDIPGEAIYSSSKSALDKGFEILAADLSRFGVNFIKVHPSMIDTPMTENLNIDQKNYMLSKQSSKKSPTTEELAKYILSLQNQSSFISGSSILFGGIKR